MAPPITETILPSNACAGSEAPAATTVPAPSLPTGKAWSRRPAIAAIWAAGTSAVTTGPSEILIVSLSAAPNSKPRSEGLIGVASMRTTTSLSLGSGIGTSASVISRVASDLMVERSCRGMTNS